MRFAVTGTGAVASVGRGVEDIFAGLSAGRSGLNTMRAFNHDSFPASHLFEIDDRAEAGVDEPRRASKFLVEAIREAVTDAGLSTDLGDTPVLIGTGLRELRSVELWWNDGVEFDVDELHFGTALREAFGATNTVTISNACSASLHALALAADMIEAGLHDTVVVAGVDVITESMFGLLCRCQPTPDQVRPFDRDRIGTIMGEGASAVVLQRDGARVRGWLRGVELNCDAFHSTAPNAPTIADNIAAAHDRAGVKAADIDLVMLHGTGTGLNDQAEALALGQVFDTDTGTALMTAIKSMTGHTSGGSGLLGVIVGLRALATGTVPPTVGVRELADEATEFRLVRDTATTGAALSIAQVNAFGFGGLNAVAIIEAAMEATQ